MGCGATKQTNVAGQQVASLAEQLRHADPVVRDRALRQLGGKGEEAAPYAADLVALLADKDRAVRGVAANNLMRLGPHAAGAAPAAAELLGHADPNVRGHASTVLKALGVGAGAAVPQLAQLLDHQEVDIVRPALQVLGKLRTEASPASPKMALLLAHSQPEAREAAEQAMICLGEDASPAVAELRTLLSSGNAEAVVASLHVLGGLRGLAQPAAVDMAELLASHDAEVHAAATQSIASLGAHAAPAATQLVALLRHQQPRVRAVAARLLGDLGEAAANASAAPALASLLLEEDVSVREASADALRALGPHAGFAVPKFRELGLLAVTAREDICLASLAVLERLGPSAEPAASALAELLAHPSFEVRTQAVELLSTLATLGGGDGALRAAIPEIVRLLESEDTGVRMSADAALKRLGAAGTGQTAEGGGAIAADIARLLTSPKYDVRRRALDAFGELGEAAAGAAAPAVARLLAHESEEVRQAAAEGLAAVGGRAAAPATAELLLLLTHRKDYVRRTALEALRQLGSSAVPEVQQLLQEQQQPGDWQRRRRVLEQLGQLGVDAAPFVPLVAALLEGDGSLEVQLAAAALLREQASTAVPADVAAKAEELLHGSLAKHAPPKYWTNTGGGRDFDEMVYVDPRQHHIFDELLRTTYVARTTQDRPCPKAEHGKTPGGCPCVQPGAAPGLPTAYRTRRVVRVENALMWARYVTKRDALRVRRQAERAPRGFDPPVLSGEVVRRHPEVFLGPEDALNEVYLYHGTFVRHTVSIAKMDFRIDLAGSSTGTMYGRGAYLGEAITKADEYARDEPGGHYDGIFAAILCRTAMGKFFYTTTRDETAAEKVSTGEYDSTCGDRAKVANTFRELVVYDNDQLYPEYIVLYHRVHANDTEDKISQILGLPFQMELPVYWTHCYKSLAGEAFDERFDAPEATRVALQGLVRATLRGDGWKAARAVRVENSATWRRFLEYKARLHQRLQGKPCRRIAEIVLGGDGEVLTAKHLQGTSLEHSISLENLEVGLNEHLLWHGTSPASAETIAREGFRVSSEGTATGSATGLRYGPGAYFAESLEKVTPYASGDGQSKCVLLCRVVCGEYYYTEAMDVEATGKAALAGTDSVLAWPYRSEPREFVALRPDQIYPEFILELHPV